MWAAGGACSELFGQHWQGEALERAYGVRIVLDGVHDGMEEGRGVKDFLTLQLVLATLTVLTLAAVLWINWR